MSTEDKKTRTRLEISTATKMIEKLLLTIPEKSMFGDDNHKPLRKMIEVLKGDLRENQFDRYDFYDRLEDVKAWMNGGSSEWLDDIQSDINTFSE